MSTPPCITDESLTAAHAAACVCAPCFSPVSGGAGAEPLPSSATSLDFQETNVKSAYAGETPSGGIQSPPPTDYVADFQKFWHEAGTRRRDVEGFSAVAPMRDREVILDETSPAARFRHSGWRVNRHRVWDSMTRLSLSPARRRSFGECGTYSWVEYNNQTPATVRIRHNRCNDRLCVPCGNARCVKLFRSLTPMCEGKHLSFLTLTLCGKGESLKDLQKRLYKSFRHLRSLPIWEKVRGGAAFLEFKWNDKAQRWHPHLHVLMDAPYIEQGKLAQSWHAITGDSFIVDIRRVEAEKGVQHYVTKYVTKPIHQSFMNTPKLLDEAVTAMKGVRMCFTFGDWRGKVLFDEKYEPEKDESNPIEWTHLAPLSKVIDDANHGHPDAIAVLKACGADGQWHFMLDTS